MALRSQTVDNLLLMQSAPVRARVRTQAVITTWTATYLHLLARLSPAQFAAYLAAKRGRAP